MLPFTTNITTSSSLMCGYWTSSALITAAPLSREHLLLRVRIDRHWRCNRGYPGCCRYRFGGFVLALYLSAWCWMNKRPSYLLPYILHWVTSWTLKQNQVFNVLLFRVFLECCSPDRSQAVSLNEIIPFQLGHP